MKDITLCRHRGTSVVFEGASVSFPKIGLVLAFIGFAYGCSFPEAPRAIDTNCPALKETQFTSSGWLRLENGVTLKCQVKNATNRMTCKDIAFADGDGMICSNGQNTLLFLFDENGVLKKHDAN
jgi:hypothetical protein